MSELRNQFELIAAFSVEITDRYKVILDLMPKENDKLLKHLAASSIHLAYFMRDVSDSVLGRKSERDENLDNEFLIKCGCDFKK